MDCIHGGDERWLAECPWIFIIFSMNENAWALTRPPATRPLCHYSCRTVVKGCQDTVPWRHDGMPWRHMTSCCDSDDVSCHNVTPWRHAILCLVQALPPWVYEPIISLGFSLLVVTRPHTDTDPMRWLFLKWIHNPENYVFCCGPMPARGCNRPAL